MSFARSTAVLLLVLLLLPSVAAARSEHLGKRIESIEVLGVEKVETAAILDNISLRQGDLLRAEAVAQAIRDIFRLRYFRDVRVEAEPRGEGVVLVIKVKEKPAIREVVLEGNKKITTEDIKEVMTLKAFAILDEAKVASTAQKIEELYQEKGFFLAEVETRYESGSSNEVTVHFDIRENKKVLVKRIDIVGNVNIKDACIKQRLQTKVAGPLPGSSG